MIDLMITVDYEIFGDGTGEVKENLIRPMEEIRILCNKYDAKLTVFFDICEYWAFVDAERCNLLTHLEYSPSVLMKNQMIQIIEDGHDVQLHLHPQWLGAQYINNKWHLNFNKFRVADLPFAEIKELLLKGKNDLEEMLRLFNPHYRCVAFRSGAFSVQPSRFLVEALKETGFLIDSSVIKGFKRFDNPFWFDFMQAPSSWKPWWVKDDFLENRSRQEANILEIPIYSKIIKRFWHFFILKVQYLVKLKKDLETLYPKGYSFKQRIKFIDKISKDYIRYLFEDTAVVWDFCALTHREMACLLNEAIKNESHHAIKYMPLVMIGHPKLYANQINFEKFLIYSKRLVENKNICFVTITDVVKHLFKHDQ